MLPEFSQLLARTSGSFRLRLCPMSALPSDLISCRDCRDRSAVGKSDRRLGHRGRATPCPTNPGHLTCGKRRPVSRQRRPTSGSAQENRGAGPLQRNLARSTWHDATSMSSAPRFVFCFRRRRKSLGRGTCSNGRDMPDCRVVVAFSAARCGRDDT